jgi:preprotein translocase subunit SecA
MLSHFAETVTQTMAHVELKQKENLDLLEERQRNLKMQESSSFPDEEAAQQSSGGTVRSIVSPEDRDSRNPKTWGKVSRNEQCPCGSGEKYKFCHGKLA